MIKQNNQKVSSSAIKFPQIKQRKLDFSSSFTQNQQTKLRPASLNKVQDLQKKLFAKLDVYQQLSTNKKTKKISTNIKNSSFDTFKLEDPFDFSKAESSQITDKQFDPNLEKLKTLMPHLYGKLMEAKQAPFQSINSATINSSKNIGKQKKTSGQSSRMLKSKNKSIGNVSTTNNLKKNHYPFLTQLRNSSNNTVNSIHINNNPLNTGLQKTQKAKAINTLNKTFEKDKSINMTNVQQKLQIQRLTQKQMTQIYKQYEIQEGLSDDIRYYHSSQQLKSMGQNLANCQLQINLIQKSMSSLIKQIGNIYANDVLNIDINNNEQQQK